MDIFKWAVILQLLLLLYFEAITLLNLYPWNDLSKYTFKEKVIEATVNGAIIIFNAGLFTTKVKWLMMISIVFWFLFLLMQLLTWWMPYVTGKHLKQFRRTLYDTHFKETIKLLPPIKDHIIPDAQHNVLQFLTLITFIVSVMSVVG